MSDCVHGDIGAADYITVESNYYPGNHICWDAKASFNLGSFVSRETLAIKTQPNPAWNLRLELDQKKEGCIDNGDIVYFMDCLYFYQSIRRSAGNR